MFGYLTARTDLLDDERAARYKACYCGLCRSLRARSGLSAGLTLNYDMSFLVLLLSSLYEPEESGGCAGCIAHPFGARPWFSSEITDYAADMNVALGYLKCLDNWEDDGSLLAVAEAGLLKRADAGIRGRYPRQCGAMENALGALAQIEAERRDAPDEAAAAFGSLMGELFVLRDDRWSASLRAMGDALGRFLYIMDACMDLGADTFRNRYNPFRRRYGLDNAAYFRDILQMLLGECLRHYDRLPLVRDKDILDNILCAGVWAQFDRKYPIPTETKEV
ncbi:MAG: hypothetical protein IJQ43_08255 [Oscillospiraceae bacterium]|nr:hypothetical protein [Oscillospiraceae bacterium]